MIINLTLIIQIINVIAAYQLIKYLFFTPYYHVLLAQEHQERLHVQKVEHSRQQVIAKQKELEAHWHLCQKHFLETMPLIEDKRMIHADSADIVSKPAQTPAIDKQTIKTYAHQLFEKVRNVF